MKMQMLISHVWRNMLRMRYRVLAVCLIAAGGFAMYVGVYSAIQSLFAARSLEYARANMADLEIRFAPDDEINLPTFDDIPGVVNVESRLIFPGHLTLKDGSQLAAILISLSPRQSMINRLSLIDGQPLDPHQPNGVVIERNLAAYHGYDIGDEFELAVGSERYRVKVSGIVLSPEYLIAPANPSIFVPTKGSLGVVFAPSELIQQKLGFRLVNSLLFTFSEEINTEATQQRVINRAATRLTIDQNIPLTEQFGYQFLEHDLKAFKLFLPAVVVVFSLTAFLVILFLMFQWITRERQEIGTFMAVGYRKLNLSLAYLYPALWIWVLAILLGGGLSFVLLYGFAVNYAQSIGLPKPTLAIDGTYLFWGSVGVLATVVAAVSWPQAWLLTLTPLEAVRNTNRRTGSRLGVVAALVAHLPGRLWLRYAFRNILRNKAASAMTVFAVALGLGLTISFFISLTSYARTAVDFAERDPWTAMVDFFAPVWVDNLDKFDRLTGIEHRVPYVRGTIQLVKGNFRKNIYITGLPPKSRMRDLTILEGRGLSSGDDKVIVLERKVAADYSLRVGDLVEIVASGRRFEARLVGILSGALPGESYAPIGFAQELLDLEERVTGLFLIASATPKQLKRELYSLDDVAQVTFKHEVVRALRQATSEIAEILYIAEAFGVGVAILFIFSNVAFTILPRKSEYGLLRIIGFADQTVAAMIIAEVVLVGLASAVLAIAIGYGLAVFLNFKLSEAWFTVNTMATTRDFWIILVPALFLLPVAAWPTIRIILKEELPHTLRERRFG